MDEADIAIIAIRNIRITDDIYNFWIQLENELKFKILQKINGHELEQELLLAAVFLHEDFDVIDVLITDDILNRDLEWTRRINNNRMTVYDEPLTTVFNQYQYNYDIEISHKSLLAVALQNERDDLIQYLLEAGAEGDFLLLEEFKKAGKLYYIIDYSDLTEETILILLSLIDTIEDFIRLANKNVYISYEKARFDEMGLISPVDNMLANENLYDLELMINYGLKIEPDATYYFENYPWVFNLNNDLTNLFEQHGGDKSVLEIN